MNRRAQSGQFTAIVLPMIVVAILAVSFATVAVSVGQNYNVDQDDQTYGTIVNQTSAINSIANRTSESVLNPSDDRSNVLTAIDKLTTGAYNAFLVLADVPGIYMAVMQVVANSLSIPPAVVTLVISGIILSILSVVIYLALGRT
jgi:hypothetical protein